MILRGDVARLAWTWPHFSPKEMADRLSGDLVIDTESMDRLESLRVEFARPMIINSAYRDPAHNAQISTTGLDGPHTTGCAVDVKVYGEWAWKLDGLSRKHGFTGVGVHQLGPIEGRYLHLDTLTAPRFPRPNIWSYPT